jgi:hypothetical protein
LDRDARQCLRKAAHQFDIAGATATDDQLARGGGSSAQIGRNDVDGQLEQRRLHILQ